MLDIFMNRDACRRFFGKPEPTCKPGDKVRIIAPTHIYHEAVGIVTHATEKVIEVSCMGSVVAVEPHQVDVIKRSKK